jgi:hypothetical protein
MNTNKVETCICLLHIGDNGPCEVHSDPNHPARYFTGPRMTIKKAKRRTRFIDHVLALTKPDKDHRP